MVNSPIPKDLAAECKKAAKILNSFIDPIEAKGPDKVIPQSVLQKAKGFAIFTVIKAGFLFSGRAGSGLVISKLEDGSWSAPSAIGTGGMGFGGQIGAEMTDFVIVLNSREAVKTFTKGGNVTLGGNLSVAAGPIGRTAEGAGSVSLGHAAAIFSYSKSKGLFAGVSIEGSIVVERKDANEKFYQRKVNAKELLSGQISPPPQADVLYRALNSMTKGSSFNKRDDDNDEPHSPHSTKSVSRNINKNTSVNSNRFSTPPPPYSSVNGDNSSNNPFKKKGHDESRKSSNVTQRATFNSTSGKPPLAPKPPILPRKNIETAVAAFDFQGEQDDDLSFNKGDIIVIKRKTDSINDWWFGSCNGKEGNFPANYLEIK
ncbi:11854_t:CDS:1 [Funneliformis geosporum]|uniref:14719_t:CDS:1 n=1 Tax=Funneliformis geosporum TaxID=1117311 RepID=A0A9W4WK38_9GLOM|nr:14719_t:CDS:1 [Funneliformis geosporum]CAI2170024.1 11854_t:CDS:1 [Funneliformis geosporum]